MTNHPAPTCTVPVARAAGALIAGLLTAAAPAQTTPMTEVVMYGADGDTAELLRYSFLSNDFLVIGQMRNQNDELMTDMESLAYIPSGVTKGFYGVCVSGGPSSSRFKLSLIEPTTAKATVFGIGGAAGPLNYTRAMTARLFDPGELGPGDAGGWRLLAMRTRNNNTECYMVVVDPVDGQIIPVPNQTADGLPVRQGATFVQLEGLAIDETGACFGVSYHATTNKSRLWHLQVNWPAATIEAVPVNGYVMPDRMEALEFAFGDNEIDPAGLPGAASTWGHPNGVLLGFSDDEDSLVVMNADLTSSSAGAWEYLQSLNGQPLAFMSIDTEGIAFTTRSQDPNEFLVNPFD